MQNTPKTIKATLEEEEKDKFIKNYNSLKDYRNGFSEPPKTIEEKELVINRICSVRFGSMDDKQFKATLEYNINLLLSEQDRISRESERKNLVEKIEEKHSAGLLCRTCGKYHLDELLTLINSK